MKNDNDDSLEDWIKEGVFEKETIKGAFEIIANLIKGTGILVLILLSVVGYIANFFAIYEHWNNPITIGYLSEFVGVIVFPLGILTGWLFII